MKTSNVIVSTALFAIAISPLAALADSSDYHGGNMAGSYDGANGRLSGIVASVHGGAVTLRNGRTIFLQNGTTIEPTGASIQPGERLSVSGFNAGDGNINARDISIYANSGYDHRRRHRDADDRRYRRRGENDDSAARHEPRHDDRDRDDRHPPENRNDDR